MRLTTLDVLVIAAYFALNLGIGLWYRRRALRSTEEYFAGGRRVGWFLAGTSMVATTFAADTPLAVTGLVAAYGIAGNWLWWHMLLSAMLTVFLFARLWRRAGVLTDVEFAELRYGGRGGAFLRGFRAVYLGLPVNCIVLGWVNLAMVKILMVVFPDLAFPALGLRDPKLAALAVVLALMLVTASISTLSGLWGVLVTDLVQFILKMGMVIVLAWFAVRAAGGMPALTEGIQRLDAARGGSTLDFLPQPGSAWMPWIALGTYLGVTWWASWYPGSEPGGGGYVAQRMLSARDERHSLLATLWFTFANYAIRPWPWILAALASLVLYPGLADKEAGYVRLIVDPAVLPPALRGLMLAAFAAAYMSTVATQLNWGASYLVNDLYRRFWACGREERHYVRASQAATVLLMLASCAVTYLQDSVAGAWRLLLALGAGTGSVLILRWFWWRINAWSEISAMAASFVVSLSLQAWAGLDPARPRDFAWQVLLTVGASTTAWVLVTLLTPAEPPAVLEAFYRRIRPPAALWGPVARRAPEVAASGGIAAGLLDWALGCALVYGALFAVGKALFRDWLPAAGLALLALACGAWLYRRLARVGWKVVTG